jgi:hypothetical protein
LKSVNGLRWVTNYSDDSIALPDKSDNGRLPGMRVLKLINKDVGILLP